MASIVVSCCVLSLFGVILTCYQFEWIGFHKSQPQANNSDTQKSSNSYIQPLVSQARWLHIVWRQVSSQVVAQKGFGSLAKGRTDVVTGTICIIAFTTFIKAWDSTRKLMTFTHTATVMVTAVLQQVWHNTQTDNKAHIKFILPSKINQLDYILRD